MILATLARFIASVNSDKQRMLFIANRQVGRHVDWLTEIYDRRRPGAAMDFHWGGTARRGQVTGEVRHGEAVYSGHLSGK
jgi:hypothetical protein